MKKKSRFVTTNESQSYHQKKPDSEVSKPSTFDFNKKDQVGMPGSMNIYLVRLFALSLSERFICYSFQQMNLQ